MAIILNHYNISLNKYIYNRLYGDKADTAYEAFRAVQEGGG
jgi:hypothetical protein